MMRTLLALALVLLAGCSATVTTPPKSLGIPPYYSKFADANGVPVIASRQVNDEAILRSRAMITDMLMVQPELSVFLREEGYRVAIMAESEAITDLPKNANWTKPAADDPRLTRCERKHYEERIGRLSDREYWNARVRGIGGKFTVAAEEDVLGKRSSRYWGETILVHEFAHNVLYAIQALDPALYAEVEAAYVAALEEGLWKDEYASTTVQEYWAEGTQFWFNSNRLAVFDGRQILNHTDLIAYDPRLAAVLRQAYGDRHRLKSDPFHMHPARVPPGPIPENTAEVC